MPSWHGALRSSRRSGPTSQKNWRDVMTRESSDASPRHVDALVVCALAVEFRALQDALADGGTVTNDPRLVYLTHSFVRRDGFDVLIVQLPLPGAGNVTSGTLTASLLPLYDPWLVVSFGIAGTLDGSIAPKSITYSRSVAYIDLRKETDSASAITKRIPQIETQNELLNHLGRIRGNAPVHVLDIVSSEAVVKSNRSQRRIVATQAVADAKVVEMEAFGVLQACALYERLTGAKRYYVAIKGITDEANPAKDDTLHEDAAVGAARFVRDAFDNADIRSLRNAPGVNSRPLPFRPFIARAATSVATENFLQCARTALDASTPAEIVHGIHLRHPRPRIFYHWRLTAVGLHWVDLRFLRVIRRLADAGYPVECLVTDRISNVSHNQLTAAQIPAAKHTLKGMLRQLFAGCDFTLTFYSDVEDEQDVLAEFGQRAGCDQSLIEELTTARTADIPGKNVNIEFNLWLRHIAWRSRLDGTCLVFINPLRRDVYSLLWHFGDLLPGLLPTPTVTLGGRSGKFKPPGRDLILLPPHFTAVMEWLQKTSNVDWLKSFWTQITTSPEPTDNFGRHRKAWFETFDHSPSKVPVKPRWLSAMAGEPTTADWFRGAIAVELAYWNHIFETGGVAADFRCE